jgi:hypothetical protein
VQVDVRHDQRAEEEQWIDDEQPRVADRKMRDAGRRQRDREPGVGELSGSSGNASPDEGDHSEHLRDCQFDSEIIGKPEMDERAFHRAHRVGEIEIDGAEHHHRGHD